MSTFFVILLPLVLMFMALCFDGMRIFVLKHELQSVVDAASLAGSSAIQAKLTMVGNVPVGTHLELDPITADLYAIELLNENIAKHNFDKQGITNVQVIENRAVDTDVDGILDGYYMKVSAEIESFLYGPLTGSGRKITIVREAEARAKP
ncbi:MAG: Tad domain-containing protein [Peptococcaceae bacterium]|nr:Tad domain-containing protein [Peptococcaceae bacterium]